MSDFPVPPATEIHTPIAPHVCARCGTALAPASRFCTSCGMKHTEKAEVIEHTITGERPMLWPLLQYGILLAICAIVKVAEIGTTPVSSFVVDILLAAIVIMFALRESEVLRSVFVLRSFNVLLATGVVVGAIAAAFIVDALAGFLESMAGESYRYYMFEDTPMPILLSIISIGVFPAIFEEIAFRGILFAQVNRVVAATPTIFVTGVAFFILHLSPVSVLWLLPIGIVTAWMRHKTGTIWYGIILHFVYNSSIVLFYFLK